MTDIDPALRRTAPTPPTPTSRAGRDLPKAIASGVVLAAAVILSLVFWKPAFMLIVAAAVVVAMWELHRGFQAKDIDLPQEPLMLGGVVMVVVAYLYGAPALVTATAVTGLVTMLWLLRRGVHGFVRDSSASIFTIFYVPFLGSFVALLLAADLGVEADRDLHRGDGRLRHRRLHRRRALRQAPDGARDLPEEVLGRLRRLDDGDRRWRWGGALPCA